MSERLHGARGSARRAVAAIDRAPDGGEAAYLAALEGDFQIRPCGGRGDGCLRQWQLAVSSGHGTATLAAGAVPPLGIHAWHRLELAFAAATVTARIDGTEVASRTGHGPAHGEVGIGLGGYESADFDNLLVAPTS